MLKYRVRKKNDTSMQLALPVIDETQQFESNFGNIDEFISSQVLRMQKESTIDFKKSNSSSEIQNDYLTVSSHKKIENELLTIMADDSFEAGVISDTERYIEQLLTSDAQSARMIINSIFLKYISKINIIIGLLHAISHLDYWLIYPEGPTMAIAALSHQNIEVKEWGIRAFENWGDHSAVSILLKIRCSEKWLDDYRLDVINDLSRGE